MVYIMRYLVYRGGYKSLEGLIMFEDNENSPLSHLYSFNSEKKALYASGAPFIEGELLNIVPEKDLFLLCMIFLLEIMKQLIFSIKL